MTLAAIAAAVFLSWLHWGHSNSPGNPFALEGPSEPPGEYLYLDTGRVIAYLSQIQGGIPKDEQLTFSQSQSVSGNLTVGGAGAQGTNQTGTSLQETITSTDASQFNRLEGGLEHHHWLTRLNANGWPDTFRRNLALLPEGSFVAIRNCRLVLPAYAAAYSAFKERIPSLPLTLTIEAEPPGQNIELLFPISFRALANEPSLFSTQLTVVGKIIRQVTAAHPSYVDVDTRASFAFDIEHSQNELKKKVGHLPVARLENAFSAAVTVDAPGAVILPIAIFK